VSRIALQFTAIHPTK